MYSRSPSHKNDCEEGRVRSVIDDHCGDIFHDRLMMTLYCRSATYSTELETLLEEGSAAFGYEGNHVLAIFRTGEDYEGL